MSCKSVLGPRHHWFEWQKWGPSNLGHVFWVRKCGFCTETQWKKKRPKKRKKDLARNRGR